MTRDDIEQGLALQRQPLELPCGARACGWEGQGGFRVRGARSPFTGSRQG